MGKGCGGVQDLYPGLSAEGVNAHHAPHQPVWPGCPAALDWLASHTGQNSDGPMLTPTEQFRVFPCHVEVVREMQGKFFTSVLRLEGPGDGQISVKERAIHDVAFCKRC